MVEGKAFVEVVHPDPGVELVERCREPDQILFVSAGRDVDVVRDLERHTLGDGGKGADDDVVDSVPVKYGEDVLGRKIRPRHLFLALAANLETLRR